MKKTFGVGCLFSMLLFSCKHHPSNTVPAVAKDASAIDSLIKANESKQYVLLADTAKPAAPANKNSSYYSVTRFYYNKDTKELFKAENILQGTSKIAFVAYYNGGQVVKTSAHTEFGWYNDYFLPSEQEDKADAKRKSPFRQQCWLLAKAQQSIFQRKMG